MATGVVKWFNVHRRFGFILPDDGGWDVFVHLSATPDRQLLKEGQGVAFDATDTPRGPRALNVRLCRERDAAPSAPRRGPIPEFEW